MRGAKQLFSISGFPIYVHFTFLILLAFFVLPGWGDSVSRHATQLAWIPILFIAILVHELGHAYAIKKLGYGRSKIMLWGTGGVCINSGGRRSPKDGMWISAAGPIAGALLGIPAVPLLFFELGSVVDTLAINVVIVTIGFSIFNLFPIIPLDGGHILVHAIRRWSKRKDRHEWAVKTAGLVGLIAIVPLAIGSLWFLEYWMLLLLFFIGQQSWTAWRHGTQGLRM